MNKDLFHSFLNLNKLMFCYNWFFNQCKIIKFLCNLDFYCVLDLNLWWNKSIIKSILPFIILIFLLRTLLFVHLIRPINLWVLSLFFLSIILMNCLSWWSLSSRVRVWLPWCVNWRTRVSRRLRTYSRKSSWIRHWITCALEWFLLGIIRLMMI